MYFQTKYLLRKHILREHQSDSSSTVYQGDVIDAVVVSCKQKIKTNQTCDDCQELERLKAKVQELERHNCSLIPDSPPRQSNMEKENNTNNFRESIPESSLCQSNMEEKSDTNNLIESLPDSSLRQSNMEEESGESPRYDCNQCNKTFTHEFNLRIHKKRNLSLIHI